MQSTLAEKCFLIRHPLNSGKNFNRKEWTEHYVIMAAGLSQFRYIASWSSVAKKFYYQLKIWTYTSFLVSQKVTIGLNDKKISNHRSNERKNSFVFISWLLKHDFRWYNDNIINLNLVKKQNLTSLSFVLHNLYAFCFEELTQDVTHKPHHLFFFEL